MSISPGHNPILIEQYALWRESYHYGTKSPLAYYPLTGGWTGNGGLTKPDGTSVPISVTVTPETVPDEGGTVDLEIDAASLLPGCYPYDIWLHPPGDVPFKWMEGVITVNPSQVSPV